MAEFLLESPILRVAGMAIIGVVVDLLSSTTSCLSEMLTSSSAFPFGEVGKAGLDWLGRKKVGRKDSSAESSEPSVS
jgi:hypothetical protein